MTEEERDKKLIDFTMRKAWSELAIKKEDEARFVDWVYDLWLKKENDHTRSRKDSG